jgi:peroxin-6
MLKAVTRQAFLVDSKIVHINAANISSGKNKISTAYFFDHFATDEDVAVMVTEEDFISAERELVPSVSMKELEHYRKVRSMFEKVEKEEAPSKNGKGKEQARIDGVSEWQKSDDDARPKSNGKGKGKEKAVDRKGKGKDKSVGRWDEGSDDEDREFFDEKINGHGVGGLKGKGKAVDMGFQQGREEDDEGLY